MTRATSPGATPAIGSGSTLAKWEWLTYILKLIGYDGENAAATAHE
jgi:hypothetical protein